MSISPSGPQEQPVVEHTAGAVPRWITILFVVLFVVAGYLVIDGFNSRRTTQAQLTQSNQKLDQLSSQIAQLSSKVADLRGELDLTTQKLGITENQLEQARSAAQTARREQEAANKKLQTQLGKVREESDTKIGQVSTDLSGAKTDIDATKKDLEATKTKLERSMGDLGVMSGLIAHNKDELDALKRLGERNIFEFDLHRTKNMQRVGPVQVLLRKTDTKHYKYTVDVVADDKNIEKKDKTAGEPVQFYVHGARSPYEIVVFDVKKDEIVGYLSTPKEAGGAAAAPATSNP